MMMKTRWESEQLTQRSPSLSHSKCSYVGEDNTHTHTFFFFLSLCSLNFPFGHTHTHTHRVVYVGTLLGALGHSMGVLSEMSCHFPSLMLRTLACGSSVLSLPRATPHIAVGFLPTLSLPRCTFPDPWCLWVQPLQ